MAPVARPLSYEFAAKLGNENSTPATSFRSRRDLLRAFARLERVGDGEPVRSRVAGRRPRLAVATRRSTRHRGNQLIERDLPAAGVLFIQIVSPAARFGTLSSRTRVRVNLKLTDWPVARVEREAGGPRAALT